jgi:carboxylesterase type B
MQEFWTNFAKTGNPNGANMPVWPAFDPEARGNFGECVAFGRIAGEHVVAEKPWCKIIAVF